MAVLGDTEFVDENCELESEIESEMDSVFDADLVNDLATDLEHGLDADLVNEIDADLKKEFEADLKKDFGTGLDNVDELLPSEVIKPSTKMPVPRDPGRTPFGPVERGSLGSYFAELNNYPVLSKTEEKDLVNRYYFLGDQEAGKRLVTGNLRLVVKIAMDYQAQWLNNLQDLIQEGNIGLLEALKKFDPSKGVKFGYYATYWIKSFILRYIINNWRMVKIGTTQAQRKLFYRLKKEREKILKEGLDPNPELLADRLGATVKDVEEMSERIKSGNEISLDNPLTNDGTETKESIIPSSEDPILDILVDREVRDIVRGKLKRFKKTLDYRENLILEKKLLSDNPLTYQELGEEFGVSRERVRQLSDQLMDKLRAFLVKEIPQFNIID